MQGETGDVTGLLASWRAGDHTPIDRLLHLLQRELHRIARRHLACERKYFARAWLRRELSGERLAKSEPREAD